MSRIGKQPVILPPGTTATKEDRKITLKGPKGEISFNCHPLMEVKINGENITVFRKSDEKLGKSLHGLTRATIQNMVTGVNEGFKKTLEINGVGYKIQVQGKKLVFNLGFSHPVEFKLPEGIEVEIDKEKKNIFTVSGIDKHLVGQIAANLRSLRKPEPYKGKGIKYLEETIRRKAGKTAASSGAEA